MVNLKLKFPEHFFEGETRDDYYVSPEMKKVWAVELDLLAEVDRVCKKYEIKYFVGSGTLLGAVRHKGMIPWDDDIDLVMMRDEFEKLCEIGPHEFKQPYFFQTEESDPGSMRGHIQIRNGLTTAILKSECKFSPTFNQGIFLDIFPLDFIPEKAEDLEMFAGEIQNAKRKLNNKTKFTIRYSPSEKIWKRPVKYLVHLWAELTGASYKKEYDDYTTVLKKFDDKPTGFVDCPIFCPCKKIRKNQLRYLYTTKPYIYPLNF